MRIGFDLDRTLIPAPGSVMQLEPLGWAPRMISREPLRAGTPKLLLELRQRRHEIWLYTSSLQSAARLRLWFRAFGVRIDGIINQTRHDAVLLGSKLGCSKYPPAFGIELLVDDSEGVATEGKRLGFAVLRIEEDDVGWCSRVVCRVAEAEQTLTRAGGQHLLFALGRC